MFLKQLVGRLQLNHIVNSPPVYRNTMRRNYSHFAWGCIASLYQSLASVAFASAQEAVHVREYFFVGGQYVNTTSGTLLQNQMYVEKLSPTIITQSYPIILVHGGGQDGLVRTCSFCCLLNAGLTSIVELFEQT